MQSIGVVLEYGQKTTFIKNKSSYSASNWNVGYKMGKGYRESVTVWTQTSKTKMLANHKLRHY